MACRKKPQAVASHEVDSRLTAGAYGFVHASNYNARPRPAEVLVDGDTWTTILKRETYEDPIRGEWGIGRVELSGESGLSMMRRVILEALCP